MRGRRAACRPDVELKLAKRCLRASDVAAAHGLEEHIEIVLRRRGDWGRRSR